MYALFVELRVHRDKVNEFVHVCVDDAMHAVRDEEGCLRFDLLRDAQIPTRFFIYEVYRDVAAFKAHKETAHFRRWKATIGDLCEGELIRTEMETVFPAAAVWERQKALGVSVEG